MGSFPSRDDPAFPRPGMSQPENGVQLEWFEAGMSLRTYLAGQAMQGLLAGSDATEAVALLQSNTLARAAVKAADDLIAELQAS